MTIPRRTISELIARYRFEPSLRDLYVEGHRDKTVYGWYTNARGYRKVSVFKIDSIHVPKRLVESYGFPGGNRSRIIVLALELDKNFAPKLKRVRCIADKDFDVVFGNPQCAEHLYYTDYTSVDMYAYSEEVIGKVLCLRFGYTHDEVRLLYSNMSAILKKLFAMRAANLKLGWKMKLPHITRCCELNENGLVFKMQEYVKRCLESNNRHQDLALFRDTYLYLMSVLSNDIRHCILGKDCLELLGWYLHHDKKWKDYRRGEQSAASLLLPALEKGQLAQEPLFRELDEILG